jgi:endo-beta-N-acetylglucosaminidase D
MKIRYEAVVLIIATLLLGVFVTLFLQKNGEVKRYRARMGQLEYTIIIKDDTISYLKKRIEESDKNASVLHDRIASLEPRRDTIYINSSKYTTSEKYEALQCMVGEKLDSANYPFSGNQIDSLFVHEQERFLYMEVLMDYDALVDEMRMSITQRDSLTYHLSELNTSKDKRISELSLLNKECSDKTKGLKKDRNILFGSTVGLAVLLVVSLL